MTLKQLIRFDGLAALASGCIVLFFAGLVSDLSGLPTSTLSTMARISFGYALYSLSLSTLAFSPSKAQKDNFSKAVRFLIAANCVWALVCIGVLLTHTATATLAGYAYLSAEALVVAILARLEWIALRSAATPATIRR